MMGPYTEEGPTRLQLFTKNATELIFQKLKTASEEFSFLILKTQNFEIWELETNARN